MSLSDSNKLFPHPFTRAYWRQAALELRNTRILVFAALMIALRLIFKPLNIPITADLRINTAQLINAFGAAVFGPVVAAIAAAITDTLGCILYPSGPYFFPFIFTEIAGSVIFALFLYRAELTVRRIMLARFSVSLLVNLVLQTPIMMLYYQMVLGRYYAPFDLLRIVKNVALFPIETVALVFFFRLIAPPLRPLRLLHASTEKLRFDRKTILTLALLFVLGVGAVVGYTVPYFRETSLSASYTQEERTQRNEELRQAVLAQHEGLAGENTVAVVEKAIQPFLSREITYTVAVYEAGEGADLAAARGYSKSKAQKDPALTRLFMATVIIQQDTGEVVRYEEIPDNP